VEIDVLLYSIRMLPWGEAIQFVDIIGNWMAAVRSLISTYISILPLVFFAFFFLI
jgi:hypothetical protein